MSLIYGVGFNSLTPCSSNCEVMLLHRGSFTGPLPLITIGNVSVAWACHKRLLGIIIDRKLTWVNHFMELRNSFVKKLSFLKRCSFLKRKSLLDLHFKVILPSVIYGIALWGNQCNNLDYIKSLQALHCRAGRLIFNLPREHHQYKLWNSHNGTRFMTCINEVLSN